jgi:hypothetical protein
MATEYQGWTEAAFYYVHAMHALAASLWLLCIRYEPQERCYVSQDRCYVLQDCIAGSSCRQLSRSAIGMLRCAAGHKAVSSMCAMHRLRGSDTFSHDSSFV